MNFSKKTIITKEKPKKMTKTLSLRVKMISQTQFKAFLETQHLVVRDSKLKTPREISVW